jgi:voltage-gated sodium channel
MPGVNFIERLGATSQAIRDQQLAANRLAGALGVLAMETDHMESYIRASGMPKPLLKQGPHQGPLQMDMVIPGIPSMPCSIVPTDDIALPPSPPVDMHSESLEHTLNEEVSNRFSKRSTTIEGRRLKEIADAGEARKKTERRVFSDTDELRNQIREKLTDEIYDATKLYKETGTFQATVRSPWFEMFSMLLVIFSCIWMAVEMDYNDSMTLHESHAIFQVIAHLTCLLFLLELIVRILAFRRVCDAVKDCWIAFDSFLVSLFVLETWILSTIAAAANMTLSGGGMKLVVMFRVLRLLRVLRLARVLRVLPELMVIIRGLGRALRAIIVVLALIGIIIFVAAIVFTAALEDSPLGNEYFPTVATSMGTLMLDCTLSGTRGIALMRAAWAVHPIFAVMMLVFVLLANITMLGVLTGLLVQTVKTVAEVEKEEKAVQQLRDTMEEMWSLILEHDTDGDESIEPDEFADLIAEHDFARVLRTLDVDVEGLASVSDFIFAQNRGRLGRKEFMQMVLDVRNNKTATVKDHIETRRFMEAKLLKVGNGGGQ